MIHRLGFVVLLLAEQRVGQPVERAEQVAMHLAVERFADHQGVAVRLFGLLVLAEGDLYPGQAVEIVHQRRVERTLQFGADLQRGC